MYICLCRSLTDKQVHQAACQGARCNSDLSKMLGKPPECGQCGKHTRKIIQKAIQSKKS